MGFAKHPCKQSFHSQGFAVGHVRPYGRVKCMSGYTVGRYRRFPIVTSWKR
jgi:hypothetical protein